ncbi:MAG: GAF domain-containing protein, partial [Armatimonadetes bacterium]|nr:GAF domain-containing protein [Armatimonadota bacterium]
MKERQQMIEEVFAWGREISQAMDISECLRLTYEFIRNRVGLDRVGIFLYDSREDKVRRLLGTDRDGKMVTAPQVEFDLRGGTFAEALKSPSGFVYTSNYTESFELAPDHPMFGVKEHIVVAMRVREKPVGFLCADNLLSQRPITQMQIEALRLIAGYTAVAIENTRLLQERERRNEMLEKVWKVSREISRVTGLRSCVLQIRNAVINEFGF